MCAARSINLRAYEEDGKLILLMRLPQPGEIVSYSISDAVGRIRLSDGTELRFGGSVLHGVVPAPGTRVVVRAVAPHALGGFKALDVGLAEADQAAYKEKAAAFESAAAQEIQESRQQAEQDRRRIAASAEPDPLTDEEAATLVQRRKELAEQDILRREAEQRAEIFRRGTVLLLKGRSGADAWQAVLQKTGVPPRDADKVLNLARPAALLVGTPAEAPLETRCSKLGGDPDLPPDFVWPSFKERPLSFLAQVRLASIPVIVRESLYLPADGLLSFFFEAQEQPLGFDPADKGCAAVYFTPDLETVKRLSPPASLSSEGRFNELCVRVVQELRLPSSDSHPIETAALDRDALDAYIEALGAYDAAQDTTPHLLGGHPAPIQGAMERECALVTHGIYTGNQVDASRPEVAAAVREASEWRLLLQLDSDELMGTAWGDGGRLYYWMREADLRERLFERAWCILQCY